MFFYHYRQPTPEEVKFHRLVLSILIFAGVLTQHVAYLYVSVAIAILTFITTIHYSITSLLYTLIKLVFKRNVLTIPSAYQYAFELRQETEFFELFARSIVTVGMVWIYTFNPTVAWLIATAIGLLMLISAFFGFCMSAVLFITYRIIRKRLKPINIRRADRRKNKHIARTNQHCLLARNGFKPYARCDYCSLKVSKCEGVQSTGFLFAIAFLVSLFPYLNNPMLLLINIIIITGLLFWLTRKITVSTDQLATANFQNHNLNGQLKRYNQTLEDQVKRRTQDLEKLVKHDSLTGLANRLEFERQLEDILQDSKSSLTFNVVCYIDLDQFKIVNDKCGHNAGDELLRQIALIFKRITREDDLIARLGGDEFGVIYRNSSIEHAEVHARRLLDAIGEYRFHYDGNTFAIGASIGMVSVSSEEHYNLATLMSQADMACYAAKDEGRHRIHIAHAKDMSIQERRNQMQWIGEIELALEQDHFVLYVQSIAPIKDLSKTNHYEVLVRLHHADHGIISPMAFLPAAQRYGFMARVDRWVARHTFQAYQKIDRLIHQEISLSVNISGATLGDESAKQYIRNLFDEYQVPYCAITFEVTESEAISNITNALSFINAFKSLGCKFALDDFGSGLSSFSYLQNLPVDYLKIDGSFVRDIHTNPINRAMVESINQIGHIMGIATVCEYVENSEIFQILDQMGADYAQGYYVNQPFPIEQLFTQEIAK